MIWAFVRELMNSFWNDDLHQRCLVLFVMVTPAVYVNNATAVEQSLHESPARATAVSSYLLATVAIGSAFLWYSFFVKPWRMQVRAHFLPSVPIIGIWIGVIFADPRATTSLAAAAAL